MRERDYDGRIIHRGFSHRLDADEFRLTIRRRRERFLAGLELIPEPLTFAEWVETWMAQRKQLRPVATWTADDLRLRRVWLPLFARRKLSSIFPKDISRVLDGLIQRGNAPATRNRHRALLHRIFEEARRQFPPLVTVNPVKSIPPLPEDWRERELATLTEDEMRRYCEAAWRVRHSAHPGAPWGLVATFLCWSGVRIGEALALRWKDVSPNEVHVHRTLEISTGVIRQRTKGKGAYFALYLPPLAAAIARWGRRQPDELVCQGLDYWTARKLHKRTLKAAGLDKKLGMHALRHSFARLAFKVGLRRDDIRDILGHRSAVTTDRYAPKDIEPARRSAGDLGFGTEKPKREER